jgi:hypothetical protein
MGKRIYQQESIIVNATPLLAINPSERYATPNFLEDIRTGIRSKTTTELAAAAGEDGWTAAETRPIVLLVAAGRQPSDAANL